MEPLTNYVASWVQTDMGDRLAEKLNMEHAPPMTIRESVDGMLKTVRTYLAIGTFLD